MWHTEFRFCKPHNKNVENKTKLYGLFSDDTRLQFTFLMWLWVGGHSMNDVATMMGCLMALKMTI